MFWKYPLSKNPFLQLFLEAFQVKAQLPKICCLKPKPSCPLDHCYRTVSHMVFCTLDQNFFNKLSWKMLMAQKIKNMTLVPFSGEKILILVWDIRGFWLDIKIVLIKNYPNEMWKWISHNYYLICVTDIG